MKMRVKWHKSMLKKSPSDILIVSVSGRALAESAQRAGYRPIVLDAFCDLETRSVSVWCEKIALLENGSFNPVELLNKFDECINRFSNTLIGWIAGSGFESINDILIKLSQRLLLLGNNPYVYALSACKNKIKAKLAESSVPCIPSSQEALQLVKSVYSHGGNHIRFDRSAKFTDKSCDKEYNETYFPGISISHLFLANENRLNTVGFATQWHSRHNLDYPFYYGGAINSGYLSAELKKRIESYSISISSLLNLRGFNNIDYLQCEENIFFLELNPRISAGFSLYDEDYHRGLLAAHISAYQGKLVQPTKVLRKAQKAQAIVYASKDLQINAKFKPSKAIKDYSPNIKINASQPICSIIVQSDTAESCLSLLQYEIRNLLTGINCTTSQ